MKDKFQSKENIYNVSRGDHSTYPQVMGYHSLKTTRKILV